MPGTFTGTTPDITAGQIGALLTFVVSQAVAYGLISAEREQTIISVGGIIVSAVWKLADAYLRGARAKAGTVPMAHRAVSK